MHLDVIGIVGPFEPAVGIAVPFRCAVSIGCDICIDCGRQSFGSDRHKHRKSTEVAKNHQQA